MIAKNILKIILQAGVIGFLSGCFHDLENKSNTISIATSLPISSAGSNITSAGENKLGADTLNLIRNNEIYTFDGVNMEATGIRKMLERGHTGQGVRIAVIDSGVLNFDFSPGSHATNVFQGVNILMTQNRDFYKNYDFVGSNVVFNSESYKDANSTDNHGNNVAKSIILPPVQTSSGVKIGTATGASIFPIRILGNTYQKTVLYNGVSEANLSRISQVKKYNFTAAMKNYMRDSNGLYDPLRTAFVVAGLEGIKIINASIYKVGIDKINPKGFNELFPDSVLLLAAGNDGNNVNTSLIPQNWNQTQFLNTIKGNTKILVVGAANAGGSLAQVTQTAGAADVKYLLFPGIWTSYATPCVAGVMASMINLFPKLSMSQIYDTLIYATKHSDSLSTLTGRGMVNLDKLFVNGKINFTKDDSGFVYFANRGLKVNGLLAGLKQSNLSLNYLNDLGLYFDYNLQDQVRINDPAKVIKNLGSLVTGNNKFSLGLANDGQYSFDFFKKLDKFSSFELAYKPSLFNTPYNISYQHKNYKFNFALNYLDVDGLDSEMVDSLLKVGQVKGQEAEKYVPLFIQGERSFDFARSSHKLKSSLLFEKSGLLGNRSQHNFKFGDNLSLFSGYNMEYNFSRRLGIFGEIESGGTLPISSNKSLIKSVSPLFLGAAKLGAVYNTGKKTKVYGIFNAPLQVLKGQMTFAVPKGIDANNMQILERKVNLATNNSMFEFGLKKEFKNFNCNFALSNSGGISFSLGKKE